LSVDVTPLLALVQEAKLRPQQFVKAEARERRFAGEPAIVDSKGHAREVELREMFA
jgi:hypothetical protein